MHLITKVGDYFVDNEIIKPEEKELFTYGLQQGLIMILNVLSSIIIGIMFRMVFESIIFLAAYIPLRIYAGGYHARTQLRCYILSMGIIGATLWGIKLIHWTNFICLLITFLSGIIIFLLAPRADTNKPLDEDEKIVYKKRTRGLLSVEVFIIIAFMFLGWNNVAVCIIMAFFALSIMLLLDYIRTVVTCK